MSGMKRDDAITLPVQCFHEECGLVSQYRFFHDGSYRKLLEACWHMKDLPTVDTIRLRFNQFGAPANQGSTIKGKVRAGRPA